MRPDHLVASAHPIDQPHQGGGISTDGISTDTVVEAARRSINAAAAARRPDEAGAMREVELQARLLARPEPGPLECTAVALQQQESTSVWRVDCSRSGVLCAEVTFRFEHVGDPGDSAERPAARHTSGDEDTQPPASSTDRRLDRIIDGARDVIGRKGFHATSMREIAAAANVPIATLYLHIDKKDDLLALITNKIMEQTRVNFERGRSLTGTPTERLRGAVAAYLASISSNRRAINLIYRETHSLDRAERQALFELDLDFTRQWQEIIDEGARDGSFAVDDTHLATQAIYFLCAVWALRHWALDDYSEGDVAEQLCDLILHGLSTRNPATALGADH